MSTPTMRKQEVKGRVKISVGSIPALVRGSSTGEQRSSSEMGCFFMPSILVFHLRMLVINLQRGCVLCNLALFYAG